MATLECLHSNIQVVVYLKSVLHHATDRLTKKNNSFISHFCTIAFLHCGILHCGFSAQSSHADECQVLRFFIVCLLHMHKEKAITLTHSL